MTTAEVSAVCFASFYATGKPMATSIALINADLISAQLGAAYDRFDAGQRLRHVEMLRSVRRPEDVVVDAARRPDGLWSVTVCSADRVGALSIIAGLFTAYRMNIVNADIFTLRLVQQGTRHGVGHLPVQGTGSSQQVGRARTVRRILDIFEVQPLETPGPDIWERFRADLQALFSLLVSGEPGSAREQVIDRVSDVIRSIQGPESPLFPVTVEVDNTDSPTLTRLSIRGTDTLGFLFEFTNALAVLNVNIERAEIRTVGGETRDVFWVTEARGGKIVDSARVHELRVATVLIKHFTHLLPRSPNPAQALRQFSALMRQMLSRPDWTAELSNLESQSVLNTLADLMGVSRFLWEDFLRMQHENLFPVLLDVPSLDERKSREQLRLTLRQRLHGLSDYHERVRELNQFKDREMFRIDLRHITRRIGFREFSEELTELAEVVVEAAAALSHEATSERLGMLPDGHRQSSPWCICALGKFGGREIGFGSDIELLFIYEDTKDITGTGADARYFEEFVRTFLDIIKVPHEGIFQIDLRLRPYGEAGALANSLSGFRDYYSERGAAQQFERLALVKLRPVAGDPGLGAQVEGARDAFVYSSRPLDIDNILHLRHRQATELVPRGAVNAKYSPGGLVDVEYFIQAQQILAGHTHASVRVTNTLDAIDRLTAVGVIAAEQAEELRSTYSFLRRLIDALRVVRGHARDLTLPPSDSREFAYLVRRLQYESAAQLQAAINTHMAFARRLWQDGKVPSPP